MDTDSMVGQVLGSYRLISALRGAGLVVLLAATGVRAQPAAAPRAPQAEVKDDEQLAETSSAITQDPTILVDDPATRALAQALLVEGVKQHGKRAFDQALANFLEAYGKFPSPRILLHVASTLRGMGRLADAANTYQRYLLDPLTSADHVGDVEQLLLELDEQLTILTVRVFPRGSEVSIDAGPFTPVGSSLLTRVRPGIHLVRIRKGEASSEITVNGFEGETKEVSATLQVEVAPVPASEPAVVAPGPEIRSSAEPRASEQAQGWLITGTQYAADSGTSRERKVRTGWSGPEVAPLIPRDEASDTEHVATQAPDARITTGLVAVLRIDGEGRGLAGGVGLAIARGSFEGEVMFLRSDLSGAYLGIRYRFLEGWLRPYLAAGIPGFVYDRPEADGTSTTALAIGLRGAAGVELKINGHLSIKGDVGYEHFFVDEMRDRVDANIFVPTLGVIGRL